MKPQSEIEIRRRLAERVATARKRKGWTQQVLAERCDLPRSYIADVEGERRNPSLRTLLRVSNALGIPIHELFLDPV
ncbi:MAG TPA: helix-turn-helix transcriptional regulator [Bryobacteraceae bacterium]